MKKKKMLYTQNILMHYIKSTENKSLAHLPIVMCGDRAGLK